MAEHRQDESSQQEFPEAGKVQKVCKKWSEHEDGVLAYKLQNEEIDFHYGLNRYNRRTARDDLPVAKEIQDEEEKRHQEERMRQLSLLHQRSQEDEKMAQQVYQDILLEEENQKKKAELDDQEIARQMQEKEKRKYERYLEKQRERQLKKEREKIEKRLAKQTEEARLINTDGVEQQVGEAMEALNIQNRSNIRVRSGGQLEDEGDFTDFYVLPDDVSCSERRVLQERQDEELAKLLQEQEHKRTKAIVDQRKLREIETQDARLAEIIQEQEKIKARKTRGRREKAASDVHPGRECQMSGERIRPRSMAEMQTRQSSPSSETGTSLSRVQQGNATTPHNHSHLVTPTSLSSWSKDQEIPSAQLRDQEQCPISSAYPQEPKRHSVPSARSRVREPRSASSSRLKGQDRHSVPSGQPKDHESYLMSPGHSEDLKSSAVHCDKLNEKVTNSIPSSFPKDCKTSSGQSLNKEPHSVPYNQTNDLKELSTASPVRLRDQKVNSLSFGHSREQEPHPSFSDHYRNEESNSVSAGQLLNEETYSGSYQQKDQEIHSVSLTEPNDQESHSLSSVQLRDKNSPVSPCLSREQQEDLLNCRSRDQEGHSVHRTRDQEGHLAHRSRDQDEHSGHGSKDQEGYSSHRSRDQDGHLAHRSRDQDGHSAHRSRDHDGHSAHRSRDHDGHSANRSRDQDSHAAHRSRDQDGHLAHRSRDQDGHSGQVSKDQEGYSSHRSRDQDGHSAHRSRDQDGHSAHRSRDQDGHSAHRSRDQDGHSAHRSRDQDGHLAHRSRDQDGHSVQKSRDQEGHLAHIGHSRNPDSHSPSYGRLRDQEQHYVSSVQTEDPKPHSVSVGRSKEQEHHLVSSGHSRDARSHCSIHSNTTGHSRNMASNSSIPPAGRRRNEYHACAPNNRWSHQEPVSAPSGRRRDQVSNSIPSSRQRDQHYTSHSITHWRDHEPKHNPVIDFEPYFIKPPANLSKDPELHLINSVPKQKEENSSMHSVPINSALPRDLETSHSPHYRKTSLPGPAKPMRTSGPHFATQVKTSNSPYAPHSHVNTRVTDNSFGSPGRHLNTSNSSGVHPHESRTRNDLNETEAEEVSRWLTECPAESSPQSGHSRNSNLQEWEAEIMGQELNSSDRSSRVSGELRLPSPSPPGSYHSDDEPSSLSSGTPDFTPRKHQISNPISCTYNIATAIDPTYKRRQHEIEAVDETEPKIPLMLSRSLPVHADTELEWDPGVRGSLRRPKMVHWKHMATLQGGTLEEGDLDDEDDGIVTIQGTQFQPVQGQRRSTTMDRNKKLKKPGPKGNTCKQQ